MKRTLATVAIALTALFGAATAASAHAAPPCNDSGEPGNSDYARHHIVPATANGDHVPGTHGGFSLCLGTGRSVHQP